MIWDIFELFFWSGCGTHPNEAFTLKPSDLKANVVVSAAAALALLFMDKVDMLGMFLGVVMMGMVALFLVVVIIMGLDFKE